MWDDILRVLVCSKVTSDYEKVRSGWFWDEIAVGFKRDKRIDAWIRLCPNNRIKIKIEGWSLTDKCMQSDIFSYKIKGKFCKKSSKKGFLREINRKSQTSLQKAQKLPKK